MFWTENTCVLAGDEAIKLSSLRFVLSPTPMEIMFTEASLSFLIGSFKVGIPPVLCPSVMIIKTYVEKITASYKPLDKIIGLY